LERIAQVMAVSGLPIEELRRIYVAEVAPGASANLLQVAGEWAGFDEEWLCQQIMFNLRERPRRDPPRGLASSHSLDDANGAALEEAG